MSLKELANPWKKEEKKQSRNESDLRQNIFRDYYSMEEKMHSLKSFGVAIIKIASYDVRRLFPRRKVRDFTRER